MLKLLTCTQGHYWEKPVEDGADGQDDLCPVCGQAAETMPLLDLAPSEAQPAAPPAPPSPPPLRDKDGRPVVAGYEILKDLGKGPTGVHLYRARQLLINRTVVLKVVFAKDDPSQFAWGSLRGEATALGRLAHLNIVQVLEAGERDRQLFYNAVEHIEGPTLAEWLDGKPLPFREALALVETLARAVHHAHEKNVLHRSLKPASILLASGAALSPRGGPARGANATSLANCIPKITDFGLARRPVEGDAADVELQGELPCYLSPEQAWGRAKEIGPATDVYALGAILYELLTGRPPFRAETAAQTLDAIQYKELMPPSRLRARVPSDLDAICRKCLAKQPRRRYPSALELAEDLRRCAGGYPIKARTPGNAERFGKWIRRNLRTVALVLLGLWMCVSVLVLIASSDGDPDSPRNPREQSYRQAVSRLETDLAQARQKEAAASYLRNLALAERAIQAGDRERGKELLNRCPEAQRHWEWYYLHGLAWQAPENERVFTSDVPILSVDFSPNGQYLAAGGGNEPPDKPVGGEGKVTVWNLATRVKVWHWEVAAPVRGVTFSADSSQLALVSSSEKRGFDNEVQVRNVLTGRPVFPPLKPLGSLLTAVAFSPDRTELIVAGGDNFVRVWRAHDGLELSSYPVPFRPVFPRISGTHARLVPLSPDRGRLALISPDGKEVVLYSEPAPGMRNDPPNELRGHQGTVLALAYDEHSETLATAGSDHTVRLWNVTSPNPISVVLSGHKAAVTGITFSSDGKRLATCSTDGVVKIWDPEEKLELLTLKGYSDARGVLFGRDANRLAIVQGDKVTVLEPGGVAARPR